MIYILILLNICLLVLGQMLWKYGVGKMRLELNLNSFLEIITNIYFLSGMFVYVLATFIWLYILSKKDISLVYPLQSLSYVLIIIVGSLFFKEIITFNRWVGVLFIVLGAFLVNLR